jgi:hypothetical protein
MRRNDVHARARGILQFSYNHSAFTVFVVVGVNFAPEKNARLMRALMPNLITLFSRQATSLGIGVFIKLYPNQPTTTKQRAHPNRQKEICTS